MQPGKPSLFRRIGRSFYSAIDPWVATKYGLEAGTLASKSITVVDANTFTITYRILRGDHPDRFDARIEELLQCNPSFVNGGGCVKQTALPLLFDLLCPKYANKRSRAALQARLDAALREKGLIDI